MQTITLQINNVTCLDAIKILESKHFVSVVEKNNVDSPSPHSEPLRIEAFKDRMNQAKNVPTVSLTHAKEKWANKRKQLKEHRKVHS